MRVRFLRSQFEKAAGQEKPRAAAISLRRAPPRAAAFEVGDVRAVVVSCDLIGVTADIAAEVRALVGRKTGVPAGHVMVHCTHTHSGPNTGNYGGWGNTDEPYLEILPGRIARACIGALERLHEVEALHAVSPCEGIGLNREYDQDAPPLEECLRDDWRPAKPELAGVFLAIDAELGQEGCSPSFLGSHFRVHEVRCGQTSIPTPR
jgi:hypothetical protein